MTTTITTTSTGWYNEVFLLSFFFVVHQFLIFIPIILMVRYFISIQCFGKPFECESLNYFDLNKMFLFSSFFPLSKMAITKNCDLTSELNLSLYIAWLSRLTHMHLHLQCIHLSIELLSICIVFQFPSLIEISYAVAPHSWLALCACVLVSMCIFVCTHFFRHRLLSIHRESIAHN